MSVDLSFTIQEDASRQSVTFTENTGAYTINHTGGWGSPNEEASAATFAEVSAAKREEDGTFDREITGETIYGADIFPEGFPSIVSRSVTLTKTQLQYDDDFEDGIYKFQYLVKRVESEVITWEYSTSITKIFIEGIRCCFRRMALKYINCSCDNEPFNCFAMYFQRLEEAIRLYEENNIDTLDEIQELITTLTNKCNSEECNC